MYAQDGYTYTLIDNGNYSFSIGAVPNASSSNFATSVQGYGFTIIVPDGVTATITSSLGSAAGATFFDGSAISQPTIDGYLITETLGSPIALPAPSAGTTTPLVTIQINGSPTSGILEILANDSTLATTITALKSFMSADMIDDGSAIFPNVVDPNAAAVSGTSTFDFSTLSVNEKQLENLTIYPNPVTDIVNIQSGNTTIQRAEVYNLEGQLVIVKENQLETINMSQLHSGMYILKLYSDTASKTVKLLRK
jgi:hypothetical protein